MSVVVATRRGEGDPLACLRAVAAQRQGRSEVELVLATDAAPFPEGAALADVVVEEPDALVPRLWTSGIRKSAGARVGLLSATVVPAPGWVDGLLEQVERPDPGPVGTGGPVEPPERGGWAAWVVLFVRYHRYLLPIPEPAPDVAADNASYDRAALDAVATTWDDGFWEPFVHRALRAAGHEVVTRSSPVVRVAPGQDLGVLLRQRLSHGRHHARRQAEGSSAGAALARAIASPLVPFVLLARGTTAVTSRRRLRGRFVLCAPLLLWAHAWWAAGEALGYLDHARGRR